MEFEAFHRRLSQIHPRAARVLSLRILEGVDRAQAATIFAITCDAFDILFFRAVQEFIGSPPSRDFQQELECARELGNSLELGIVPAQPELRAWVEVMRPLFAQGSDFKQRLATSEKEGAKSPRRRRESLIRGFAIILLIIASIFFYARSLS